VESTINADSALDVGGISGSVNVVAENNIFRTQRMIADLGAGERTWDGQMNLYDTRLWIGKGSAQATQVDDLASWKRLFDAEESRSRHGAAPFVIFRPQLGPYRHELSPQEWTLDDARLQGMMRLSSDDQIGANVYVVGAGPGYLQFRETLDYNNWQKVKLPSERDTTAAAP
jgi:hypothetical protein